jgi:hypothetical protein
MIRPTAETWSEVPPEFKIERISPAPKETLAEEFSEEAVARRIDFATGFVAFVIREWVLNYVPQIQKKAGGRNNFMMLSTPVGDSGSQAATYLHCVFEVWDDEALILEFENEPECEYWSLQLYDIWHRALPYRNNQSMLSGRQLDKDDDGPIRVVLSKEDPGIANWLDTQGVQIGEVAWRVYSMTRSTRCTFHRVKFADLHRHLPPRTRKVSPAQRAAELKLREAAYQKRYHE